MSEEANGSPFVIEQVAQGQKFLIYAILLNFVSPIVASINGILAGLVVIAAIVLSFVGVFRVGSGLAYSMVVKIFLVVLMAIPLLNIVVLLLLNSRATKALRTYGYKVGLLGARTAENA